MKKCSCFSPKECEPQHAVPGGFVPVAEALRRLGISRQTLWERIRANRIEARRIVRGPQRGLYVRMEPDDQPLLAALENPGER